MNIFRFAIVLVSHTFLNAFFLDQTADLVLGIGAYQDDNSKLVFCRFKLT